MSALAKEFIIRIQLDNASRYSCVFVWFLTKSGGVAGYCPAIEFPFGPEEAASGLITVSVEGGG